MIKAKHFTEAEFKRCSPSCSLQDMKQGTMNRLDKARELAGIPFVLNSAYRSPKWEKEKGRTGTGAHTQGHAVDIRCNTNENRAKILAACREAGFTRFGIAPTYIHVDDDPTKTPDVVWLYY